MSGIVPASTIPCPVRTPIAGPPAERMSQPRRRRWDARTADGSDFGGPTLTLWAARAALIIARSRESIEAANLSDATPGGESRRAVGSFRGDLRIDNLHPLARSIRMSEAEGDFGPSRFDRGEERLAEGKVGRDRGREGASRAVEGFVKPTSPQASHPSAVEQDVDEGTLRVAAFHEDRLRPEATDGPRGPLHRLDVRDGEAGQPLRFEPVRGDEGRPSEEAVDERVAEVVPLQARTDRRHHDGVDDERERGPSKLPGDRPDDHRGVEHARLRRPHVEVVHDRAELLSDLAEREGEDRVDRPRVLGGDACDYGRTVHPDRGERLEVRLDPRAASGIAARDRQRGPHGRAMGAAGLRLMRGPGSERSDRGRCSVSIGGAGCVPPDSSNPTDPDSIKYQVPHGNGAMRARSGHIEFDKKVRWKNLIPAFRPDRKST